MKIIANTILFLCIVLSFSSCKRAEEAKVTRGTLIYVARAAAEGQESKKEFSFIARPFRSSELSFRVGGPVSKFEVYAGNNYKQGDVIAEIDPRDFRIRKEKTEAIYNQAKAEFERIGVLYEKNNISASSFEKAKADYTSAKTAFETAGNELDDTRLRAPFNGYAGEVYIERYQDIKATQPVISFIDISQLRIETYVTQEIALRAKGLQEVEVRFDARPGQTYQARIVEISKSTTANNLSYLLTALLPNNDSQLLSGMSGSIALGLPAAGQSVSIPQTALCHRPAEGDYVWTVNPQTLKVSKRKVVSGKLLPGGLTSVTSGLTKDEIVAVSGLRFLSEGSKVEISQQSPICK